LLLGNKLLLLRSELLLLLRNKLLLLLRNKLLSGRLLESSLLLEGTLEMGWEGVDFTILIVVTRESLQSNVLSC